MTDVESHDSTARVYSDVEYVFEPHSQSTPSMSEYIRELWERRRFMVAMAKADLQGPRSSTAMGELWGVLDPMFQAGVYWFLITVIRGGQGNGASYLSVVISGVFLFNFTRIAMNEGGRSIVKSKGLMLNSTFPRVLLPLAQVYKGLLELVPAAVIYVIAHLLLRRPLGQGLFLLPLLLVIQVAMGLGMALLFATLTVYIRDMSNVLTYLLRVLLFVTPVIYPVTLLSPTLQAILHINPLFTLFASYQTVFLGGVPSVANIIQSVAWATLFLVCGVRLFVKHERSFALRL